MENQLGVLGWVSVGIISCLAIWWQGHLLLVKDRWDAVFREDRDPRFKPAPHGYKEPKTASYLAQSIAGSASALWTNRRSLPRRTHAPVLIGMVVLVGRSVWGGFQLIDKSDVSFDVLALLMTVARAVEFFVIINLKSVFGPLFLALTVSLTIYNFSQHGYFHGFHLIGEAIELVAGKCPPWVEYAYAGVAFLYALLTSSYDSLLHDPPLHH